MDNTETPATDDNAGQAQSTEPAPPPASPWRARAKKWLIIGGISAVVLPALAVTAWTFITLNYTYSTGYRAGYVQKMSQRGWICSTWEGELQMVNLPGTAPERWSFTVRDDLVAEAVQSSIGRRVALEYEEHRGVPLACFGDTQYFVVGVRQVEGKDGK